MQTNPTIFYWFGFIYLKNQTKPKRPITPLPEEIYAQVYI